MVTTKTTPPTPKVVASKPAAVKVAMAPKPAPLAKAPTPKVVTVSEPVVGEPDLRKKELIDLVVTRSGVKKRDAKPVVEAMLAVLGETLSEGRELNLPPMGKMRINRTEEKTDFRVIICKLRQSTRVHTPEKPPLADIAE